MGVLSNFVMSRPFRIEISESLEELEKALSSARTASSKERLQCSIGSRVVKSAADKY
jgi:hypothetical protein